MTDSILNSTKKMCGVDKDYKAFDLDIMTHINSVFSTLQQLGIGPKDGFMLEDDTTDWGEYLGENFAYNSVKSYVYLKVRLLFDPPTNSFAVASMEKMIAEYEWRLNVTREETEWVDPVIPEFPGAEDPFADELVLDGGGA